MIKFIKTDKIHPHPDNPRKDLGDITELAESIKTSGILQNLTVVPMDGEIRELGFDEGREDVEYYAVIGHRRLAAAKLAGLEEVPCAISDMDYKTQIATMLLENMQRSDLTIYEQAQGFQMMMDLGETVSNISEKTGFSESTVRRRTKLLELDQDKFKESSYRGATLADYAELEKIEDLELRNEILEYIGTSDFDWKLRRAIEDEKRQKHFDEILRGVKEFATEIDPDNTNNLTYDTAYYGRPSDKLVIPDDIDEVEYFYCIRYDYIYIYYKDPESEEIDKGEERKRAIRDEKSKKLEELTRIAYELRQDFIKSVSNTKARKNIETIIESTLYAMAENYSALDYKELAEIIDIDISDNEDVELKDIVRHMWKKPESYLLAAAYCKIDFDGLCYFDFWDCSYRPNERLDHIYNLLKKLGYKMSEEEKALQDGTHKLFGISE